MLIGYVSDERYVALGDVLLEFRGAGGVTAARSNISGAVYADITPGPYRVAALGRDGFGSKLVDVEIEDGKPHQFRLLSDRLYGYASPRCVKSGERAEFCVHAVEEYTLELWRYGARKEHVRRIGIFDEHGPRANMQITPDGDYTCSGVHWNEFGYHGAFAQYVEAPQRSGLYYFHARSKSGEFYCFPWVVAPAAPQAPVAVFASDITWNAYNSFGGRSNYINADCLPPTPIINSRLELKRYTEAEHRTYDQEHYEPLSLERPDPYNHIDEREQLTDPIAGRQGCHMAAAEWRLLGWLEQQGFAYDLYGETQFHFDQVPLDDYRVLILSTHPEYWSLDMYRRLKDWVFHRGGRLMYLGGNGLNCEVEFLDNHRIVYQNTKWSHSEPQFAPDGREYESRLDKRAESEANLLGVVFTFPGIMTAAPYRVEDDSHWCFANTGLRNGDLFGRESLHLRVPGGASGHETDKISAQSPANVRRLAKGTNANGGGAEMVIHEPDGGGAVFSVGSICWPSSILVDEPVSLITANVLRAFSTNSSPLEKTQLAIR